MNGGTSRQATRERIIAAEVMARVFLEAWPEEAFGIFIEEIGFGLRTIGSSLIQPETGRYILFKRDASGRLVERYDAVARDGFELGRVTVWSPGARLAFTWGEPDWPEGASTDVDIRFEPIFGGTLVRLEHSGLERVGPSASRVGAGYRAAWTAALAWVARRARARGAAATA